MLYHNETCTYKYSKSYAVHVHSSRFHLQFVSARFCNLAVYVIGGSFSHIHKYFHNLYVFYKPFFAASQTSSELFLCGENKSLSMCSVLSCVAALAGTA
jgi:hypothetical protein